MPRSRRSLIDAKMKKSKLLLALAAETAALILTACGSEKTSYVQSGMDAIAAMEISDAYGYFDQAEEAGENERLILRGRGMALMTELKYDEAIECFTQALRLSDGIPEDLDYDINYYLAAAYYKSGRFDEASGVYDAILTLKPSETNSYYLRGIIRLENGSFEDANEDFKKAISLAPDNFDMVIDMYQVMAAAGYKDAGREMISECISSHSDISDYNMGRFEYYLGDYESAKSYLENSDRGDSGQVTLFLGRTYEALGDYNYAISLYNTYLDKNHDDSNIYNQMGLCQMKMERYSEALSSFQAGMNSEENSIMQTLKYNEIVAYEYMEEFQTAATLMKDYIKLYPDDSVAQREYEFLKTR